MYAFTPRKVRKTRQASLSARLPAGVQISKFETFGKFVVARLVYPSSITFDQIDAARKAFEEEAQVVCGVANLAFSDGLDPRVLETIRTAVVSPVPLRGVFLDGNKLTVRTSNVQEIYGRRNTIFDRLKNSLPQYEVTIEGSLGEHDSNNYGTVLVNMLHAIAHAGVRGKLLRQMPAEMLAYAVHVDTGLGALQLYFENPKFPAAAFDEIREKVAPTLKSKRPPDEPWSLEFVYKPRSAMWIREIRRRLPEKFAEANVGWHESGQFLRIEAVGRDPAEVDELEQFVKTIQPDFPVEVVPLVTLANVERGPYVKSLIPESWGLKKLLICAGKAALIECASAPPPDSDEFRAVCEIVKRKQGLTLYFGSSPWKLVTDRETLDLIRDYLARPDDLVEARLHRWKPDLKLVLRQVPKGCIFPGMDELVQVRHIHAAALKYQPKDPTRRGVLSDLHGSIVPKTTVRRMQGEFALTGYGACRVVGKSCFHLSVSGVNILFDCGLSPTDPGTPALPIAMIRDIDFVYLTHAHVDHSGMIPWLYRNGCKATLLATEPTFALSRLLLDDSIVVQSARHEQTMFDPGDIKRAFEHGTVVDLFAPYRLSETVVLTPFPAGHLLGATMALVEDRGVRFLYTGDISITPLRTINPAVFPDRVNFLAIEGTYGRSVHRPRPDLETEFRAAVEETLGKRGTVIIPTFGVGRSAEVISILSSLRSLRGEGKNVPVYIDGLVTAATRVYTDFIGDQEGHHLRTFDLETQRDIFGRADRWFTAVNNRAKLLNDQSPKVILTTTGMCEGLALEYLNAFGRNPANRLILTGYQHPRTVGGQLTSGAKSVRTPDGTIPVMLDVKQFGLTAHLDSEQVCGVVDKLKPDFVGLVHGENQALETLAETMRQRKLAPRVDVLNAKERYLLRPAGV